MRGGGGEPGWVGLLWDCVIGVSQTIVKYRVSLAVFLPMKPGIHGSSRCYLGDVPKVNSWGAPAHGECLRPVAGLVWRVSHGYVTVLFI